MVRSLIAYLYLVHVPIAAQASCPELAEELGRTADRIVKISKANHDAGERRARIERECESAGSLMSAELATSNAGLSCESLKVSSHVYERMTLLGSKCTKAFKEFEDTHLKVVELIKMERASAAGALDLITRSQTLQSFCPLEAGRAAGIQEDLDTAEFFTTNLHYLAYGSHRQYSKFMETASTLKHKSRDGNENCGALMVGLGSVSNEKDQMNPLRLAGISGASERSISTITGNIEGTNLAPVSKTATIDADNPFAGSGNLPKHRNLTSRAQTLAGIGPVLAASPSGEFNAGSVGRVLWEEDENSGRLTATLYNGTSNNNPEEQRTLASITPSGKEDGVQEAGPQEILEINYAAPDAFQEFKEPEARTFGASARRAPLGEVGRLADTNFLTEDASLFRRVHKAYERSWGIRVVIPLPGARLIVDSSP